MTGMHATESACTPYNLLRKTTKTKPGPASTVEEHSLRNIPSEGTAVRSSPRKFHFRRDIFSRKFLHKCLTETPTIGQVLPISQPWSRKGCCDAKFYCMKRNVALEIGPTEREALRGGLTQRYTLLRNTALIYNKQTCNLWCHHYELNLRWRQRWWMKSNVTGQEKDGIWGPLGKRERGLQVG